jgi:adenylate cyclase
MNRTERRAIERNRRRSAIRARHDKQSHRLLPQVCTLYVPDARGYVADFSPTGFRVVEIAELAKLYIEDDATSAALTFREVTGLRVAVRPYYCQHVTRSGGSHDRD